MQSSYSAVQHIGKTSSFYPLNFCNGRSLGSSIKREPPFLVTASNDFSWRVHHHHGDVLLMRLCDSNHEVTRMQQEKNNNIKVQILISWWWKSGP